MIAAVNGDAIGGGMEIVLACDLCVAVPTARFALPEPRVGLAASGGLHRLARQVPQKWAMELALTGRMFSAEEAAAMGVVNQIAPAGEDRGGVLAMAREMAELVCQNAPLALRATKEMMMAGLDQPTLEAAYAARYPTFDVMLGSDDAAEGRAAFLQKLRQGVGFMLADMATRTESARLLVHKAAALKDAGAPFSEAAAMAKVVATDAAMAVSTDAVQCYGGYGYTREYPVERYMRDAKVMQIVEGTNQIQRLVIARSLKRRLSPT